MSDRDSSHAHASGSFRWLPWLFGLSLLINGGFLGGFFYHRYLMDPSRDRLDHAQGALALSAEQAGALRKIQDEIRDETRASWRLMRERHRDLVVLLRQEPVNMAALELHLRATTEPQVAIQRNVILRMLTFRNTLNGEQKAVFNEKIEHPGFISGLAGFPPGGPMWRPRDCRKPGGPRADNPPRDR